MDPQSTSQVTPWLFLPFIVGMFALVSYFLSWVGGWRRLARDYRLERSGGFPSRPFVSGVMGWVNYRGCLTVGGDARGLYLAVLLPFRVGHPPLCIPWSDVHDRVREKWFFAHWDTMSVGPERVKLHIPSSAMKPLDGYLPPARQA